MANDTLTGYIGQPAHFYDDYLFKDAALPNAATITGTECTLNNTLGQLKIRGTIDSSLTVPSSKSITIKLQYKSSGDTWVDEHVFVSATNTTLAAGDLFEFIPIANTVKRIFRILVTADFNASTTKLTVPIEYIG
jgi:hypothetical protein